MKKFRREIYHIYSGKKKWRKYVGLKVTYDVLKETTERVYLPEY